MRSPIGEIFTPLFVGDGWILLQGLGSKLVRRSFPGLPSFIHIPLAFSKFVSGALWGLIPGYFKALRGRNKAIYT